MMNTSWPQYTCVLTFFYHGLKKLGYDFSPEEIADFLDIYVPVGANNPYNFKETDDINLLGISSKNAQNQISKFLRDLQISNIGFRYIALNTIPYRMYDEVLLEIIKNKLIVGFGYNYARFNTSDENDIIKHVSFINKFESDKIEILDYYIDDKGLKWITTYDTFINSIIDVNDGFWVLGDNNQLNFELI